MNYLKSISLLGLMMLGVIYGCNKHMSNSSDESTTTIQNKVDDSVKIKTYSEHIRTNEWIQENTTFSYNSIIFNEPIHHESFFTSHKMHLGFTEEDSFILLRKELRSNGQYEVTYQHYYKGIAVVPNQFSFFLDDDERIRSFDMRFISFAPELYSEPLDDQFIFKKVAKKLDCNYSQEEHQWKRFREISQIDISFNNVLEKKVNLENEANWSRSGPLSLIYTIKIGPDRNDKCYTVDVNSSTGEIIEIDYSHGIRN